MLATCTLPLGLQAAAAKWSGRPSSLPSAAVVAAATTVVSAADAAEVIVTEPRNV